MKSRVWVLSLALAVVGSGFAWGSRHVIGQSRARDYGTTLAEQRTFKNIFRRTSTLTPKKEAHIITKVGGVIVQLAAEGSVVEKDQVILKLDSMVLEEEKFAQVALIAQQNAEVKRVQEDAAKVLNRAKEDVNGYELRVELEQMRLDELKKGPTATDAINAETNLKNETNLLEAKSQELEVIASLAKLGYVSQVEFRQKELETTEERLKVTQADIANRKLYVPNAVAIAEQNLKVVAAQKTRDAAKERVVILERNMKRDAEIYKRRFERDELRLKKLEDDLKGTVYRSPGPGVVVIKRNRWYTYAPGRDVYEGQEIMSLPDFTHMKAIVAIDEARIGRISAGQPAEIIPSGWKGAPLQGKVVKVAEKGHDEFENFREETTSMSGTANRQVFDVEIDIENLPGMIRPNSRAEVSVCLESIENATVIPRTAIFRKSDQTPYAQVDSASGVERRVIKIVAEDEMYAAVSGVRPGERVWVIDPQ